MGWGGAPVACGGDEGGGGYVGWPVQGVTEQVAGRFQRWNKSTSIYLQAQA